MSDVRCRSCGSESLKPFLDLGQTPLADALVSEDQLRGAEEYFPLEVAFCPECTLVQILNEVPEKKLFPDDYPYFSSYSDHLLDHSRQHAQNLIASRRLGSKSFVVELASNDGYMLKNFVEMGVPVLGIDPALGPARVAEDVGVPTLTEFFGVETARRVRAERGAADVIIANNVMAHVPKLNDFVGGMAELLSDRGVITVENPYVRDLIDHTEFDTVYHEHFCYYSCHSVDALIRRHGLFLNHVEYFPNLHGGTLRWWIGKDENVSPTTKAFLEAERENGLCDFSYYQDFADRVDQVRRELLTLLSQLRADGRTVAAYGAAAKGSTLLNAFGIGRNLIDFVVDRNPHKHGKYMPGVHIPIRPVEALLEEQPDFTLILCWNFKDEVLRQQAEYMARGGRFMIPVPTPQIL